MDNQTLEYMGKRVDQGKNLKDKISTAKEHIEALKSNRNGPWMKIEFYPGGGAVSYAFEVFGGCEKVFARFAPIILAEYEKKLAEFEKAYAEL